MDFFLNTFQRSGSALAYSDVPDTIRDFYAVTPHKKRAWKSAAIRETAARARVELAAITADIRGIYADMRAHTGNAAEIARLERTLADDQIAVDQGRVTFDDIANAHAAVCGQLRAMYKKRDVFRAADAALLRLFSRSYQISVGLPVVNASALALQLPASPYDCNSTRRAAVACAVFGQTIY